MLFNNFCKRLVFVPIKDIESHRSERRYIEYYVVDLTSSSVLFEKLKLNIGGDIDSMRLYVSQGSSREPLKYIEGDDINMINLKKPISFKLRVVY